MRKIVRKVKQEVPEKRKIKRAITVTPEENGTATTAPPLKRKILRRKTPDNHTISQAEKTVSKLSSIQDDILDLLKSSMKPQYAKWRVSKWSQLLQSIGTIPFQYLDDDTLTLAFYARRYLRKYQEAKGEALKHLTPPESVVQVLENPDAELPKVSESLRQQQSNQMRTFDSEWGTDNERPEPEPIMSPEEAKAKLEQALAPSQPITQTKDEQLAELKQEDAIANGGEIPQVMSLEETATRMGLLQAIRDNEDNPDVQRWYIAESIARRHEPPMSMDSQDEEMKAMVQYCEFHLEHTGKVPDMPIPVVNIYWQPKEFDESEQAIQRRKVIVDKIRAFWGGCVQKNGDKMNLDYDGLSDFKEDIEEKDYYQEFDRCLRFGSDRCSYRIVKAAMKLQTVTEHWVTNYSRVGTPDYIEDDNIFKRIGQILTNEYYQAFLELTNIGSVDTYDPNYVKFRNLCRKYKLDIEKFLHEQKW